MSITPDTFNPGIAGEQCAEQLHAGVSDPDDTLQTYEQDVSDYYQRTGMLRHDPERGVRLIRRHMLRAISAPLFFAVEQCIAQSPQPHKLEIESEAIDRCYTSRSANPPYIPQQWAFLRATGHIAYRASARFIDDAIKQPASIYGRLWSAFVRNETKTRPHWDAESRRLSHDSRNRFLDNVVLANSTALRTIEMVRLHGNSLDTEQMSWAASINNTYFERHFGREGDVIGTSDTCPVSSGQRTLTGNIWGNIWRPEVSFAAGPWHPKRYCPANIPLPLPDGSHTTAAKLRFENVLPIAHRTLAY